MPASCFGCRLSGTRGGRKGNDPQHIGLARTCQPLFSSPENAAIPGGCAPRYHDLVHWLIDGYNLIRRSPELGARERESLEAGRRALCELLSRTARIRRDEFTVVF